MLAQLNKFLKIALLKNFMLSGIYMYSFLWFEFNHWFGSIYEIKIPWIYVFTLETHANMSRFSTEGNNGSFYTIGWAQEFLEDFSWRAELLKFIFTQVFTQVLLVFFTYNTAHGSSYFELVNICDW